MSTISIPIFVESRYKVNRAGIKRSVESVVVEHAVSTDVEVSVAIVGDRKMKALNKKYRNLDKTTNVLSFPQMEGETTVIGGQKIILGDVVISYPQVIREAAEQNVLVDDHINMLVAHGVRHLLGIHHQ